LCSSANFLCRTSSHAICETRYAHVPRSFQASPPPHLYANILCTQYFPRDRRAEKPEEEKKPSVGYILQNLPTHRKFSSCAKPHHPISSFSLCISKCPCNVQVSPCICHLSNSAPQTKVHLYNRAWADFSFGKSASRCIFDKSGYLF